MKTIKKRKQKKNIKKVMQVLGIIGKIAIVLLFFYVVFDRLQDVNGLSFFFTTWR